MGIKERIQELIATKGLSVLAFEKSVGWSNGYLRNTKSISAENCAKILAVYTDVSACWLMTGEGSMLNPTPHTTNNVTGHNVCGVNVNGRDIDIKCPTEYDMLLNIVSTNNEIVSRMQAQLDRSQAQIDELIALLKAKS